MRVYDLFEAANTGSQSSDYTCFQEGPEAAPHPHVPKDGRLQKHKKQLHQLH